MVLFVAGVMVFGSGKFFKTTYEFALFFEGSLKGLKVGSPVTHRGVEIGSVQNITIRPDPKQQESTILVVISIDQEKVEHKEHKRKIDINENIPRLIEQGLKAQLTVESLITGQLMVDLDFYPDRPIRLVGAEKDYLEIPTIPSAVEQIAQVFKKVSIAKTLEKLESAIDGINSVVNSPEIPQIINSLNIVLADTRKLVQNMDAKVESVGSSADKTLKDYGKLARNVDGKVEPLVTGFNDTTKDIRKLANNTDGRIEKLAASVEETAKEATETLAQAQETLSTVDEDSVVIYELTKTLRELAATARSMRVLADYFERHPDALVQGKGDAGGK
jgi:paraquat-inducible protein B